MQPNTGSRFDKFCQHMDAALARLQRRCPKCGGGLYRKFSILDKIGLYVPIPHTIYARHQCEQCRTCYRSFRSGTDLFLEISWLSALYLLGELKPLALGCTLTWVVPT